MDTDCSVFGPELALTATYAQRQACRKTLGIPGRVDRWLTANIRTTRIAGFKDLLMLDDVNGADCVVCQVQSVCEKVHEPNNSYQLDLFTTKTEPAQS